MESAAISAFFLIVVLLGAGAVVCVAVWLRARRPRGHATSSLTEARSASGTDSPIPHSLVDPAEEIELAAVAHPGEEAFPASPESSDADTMTDAPLTSPSPAHGQSAIEAVDTPPGQAPPPLDQTALPASPDSAASQDPQPVQPAELSNDLASAVGAPAPSLARTSPITEDAPEPGGLTSAEVFAKLNELALGSGAARPGTATGHGATRAAIVQALQDAPTLQRFAPRRPNMLPQLLSAANNDRVSVRELTSIIARDPALVGALLKIANSSYYRVTSQPVESLEKAVILLGTDGLRSVASIALLQPIFRVGGFDFPRFPEVSWEHTFRSASAAGHYNFFTPSSDPFAAELLALVLGLAGIVIFRIALDQYAKEPRLRPDPATIASLINDYAAIVARRIGAGWELSEQTLAGLNGQTAAAVHLLKPLGRSVYLGRVVGALAVLRLHRAIEPDTARRSVPTGGIAADQIDRMWERLIASSAPR